MKLIRVIYGKKDTPKELREYQIEGFGPVGTLTEFKKQFPDETFEIEERKVNPNAKKKDWLNYLAGN